MSRADGTPRRAAHPGIEVRHARRCRSRESGACDCAKRYQAHVWSARDGRRIRRTFPTLAAARAWRADALVALRKGTMKAPTRVTIAEAADAWIEGARDGTIRSRKGTVYKPSAVRGYERGLRLRVVPELGRMRLSEVTRNDVQDFVDRMLAKGLDGSTIRNSLNPVQAIYRRALQRGEVAINPTIGLDVPAASGKRDRVASPDEAEMLLSVLSSDDRAIWATAMYAGLRRGELRALRWRDVDLGNGVINVRRGWDDNEGETTGKTRAAQRSVPIASPLRKVLVEHGMTTKRTGDDLVFGSTTAKPFVPSTIRRRARAAWSKHGYTPIALHECRHTFASFMIAAGVNAKALSIYMGHTSVMITLDRYGHLFPGNEAEAASLLDAYLARAR
jgi:integrase